MLVDAPFSIRHASNFVADIVFDATAVHACEFTVRTLVVHPAFRCHDLALQNDLSVSWNQHVDSLTLNQLRRLPVKAPQHLKIISINRHSSKRGDLIDERAANDHRGRKVLSLRPCFHRI